MGLIKDIYSLSFYSRLADSLGQCIPEFRKDQFIARIFDENFTNREWKDRMKHTTRVLHTFLPADFAKAATLLNEIIIALRKNNFGDDNLAFMFFPDYIETYGMEDFNTSITSFVFITQFISCEFAVRPFILRYGKRMTDKMHICSSHTNDKVRRLSGEGCRPRLPWAMALPGLKKDPESILPILENLKNDPSESVRRSVANNLNDIAKDHPEMVLAIAAKWQGTSKESDAIVKHGCRTLLKQGNIAALKHYGLNSRNMELSEFKIHTPRVATGGYLEFGFIVQNKKTGSRATRLEYGIYYRKSRGHLAKKVLR